MPRKPSAGGGAAAPKRRGRVLVTEAECRCLIEDVANLRAARHRPVEPGQYRGEDRRAAETAVRAALKRGTRRK